MGRPQMRIAVAPELRFFLRRRYRDDLILVACDGVSSLGHVVESLGVPLTEVGSLAVNGTAAEPGYRPAAGDLARVRPVRRPQAVDSARFLLDVHLGTVARRMRLVGVDAAYRPHAADDDLIAAANAEHRVLLTQDRGLLRRRKLWLGAYVNGGEPGAQFADVLDRFAPELAPWTRCLACNGALAPVPKAVVQAGLQPGTRRTYDEFSRCRRCGQVYWRGAHARQLAGIVASATRAVRGAGHADER
jgi:uncharacterized protein